MFEPHGEPHEAPRSGEPGSGAPGRAQGSVASGDLVRAAGALAGLDAGGLSDDAALAVLDDLEEARRAVDAVTCDLVSEVDFRGLTLARFGMQTPAAFGVRYGWPAAKAKQFLGVGRTVRRLPHVGDALRDGTINLHHADVICRAANPRVVDVIAGCQEELVALAGGVRFERFARDVAALADLADQDGGHDPRPEDNRLSVADGPEGSLVLKGTFVGDLAACLRHALEARADKLFRAHREDRRQCPELAAPTRGQLLAEALADLVRAGHAAGGSRAPVVDVTLVLPATAVPPPDGVGFGAGTGARRVGAGDPGRAVHGRRGPPLLHPHRQAAVLRRPLPSAGGERHRGAAGPGEHRPPRQPAPAPGRLRPGRRVRLPRL